MLGDKKDLFPGFFILGFSIFITVSALKLGLGSLNSPGAGFIPFIAALFLFVFSFLLLLNSFRKEIISSELPKSAVRHGKTIFIVALLVGYSFLLDILGFYFVTLMLMFALFLMKSRRAIIWALIGSFATIISVYFLFELLLGVRFPRGILDFWIK